MAGNFPKTLHIKTDKTTDIDSADIDYVKDIYIAPYVGIIKWHYTHNKIWELVEYDVTP